jgi:hypothetical protein
VSCSYITASATGRAGPATASRSVRVPQKDQQLAIRHHGKVRYFRGSYYGQTLIPLVSSGVNRCCRFPSEAAALAESLREQGAGDPFVPGVNRRAAPAGAWSGRCRAAPARTRQLTR